MATTSAVASPPDSDVLREIREAALVAAGVYHHSTAGEGFDAIDAARMELRAKLPSVARAETEIRATYERRALGDVFFAPENLRQSERSVAAFYDDLANHADNATSLNGLDLRLSHRESFAKFLAAPLTIDDALQKIDDTAHHFQNILRRPMENRDIETLQRLVPVLAENSQLPPPDVATALDSFLRAPTSSFGGGLQRQPSFGRDLTLLAAGAPARGRDKQSALVTDGIPAEPIGVLGPERLLELARSGAWAAIDIQPWDLDRLVDGGEESPLHAAIAAGRLYAVPKPLVAGLISIATSRRQLLSLEGLPKEILTRPFLTFADNQGNTPLHEIAYFGGFGQLAPNTLEPSDLLLRNGHGNTVVHEAAWMGKLKEIPPELLTDEVMTTRNNGIDPASTPISDLCSTGHLDQLPGKWLTKETFLEHEVFHVVIGRGHIDQVPKSFLTPEVMVAADHRGLTPLHHAAQWGQLRTIPDHLLTEDAILRATPDGDTVLHLIAQEGTLEGILPERLLTSRNLGIRNAAGKTPADVVAAINAWNDSRGEPPEEAPRRDGGSLEKTAPMSPGDVTESAGASQRGLPMKLRVIAMEEFKHVVTNEAEGAMNTFAVCDSAEAAAYVVRACNLHERLAETVRRVAEADLRAGVSTRLAEKEARQGGQLDDEDSWLFEALEQVRAADGLIRGHDPLPDVVREAGPDAKEKLPGWVREEMLRRGLDPARPLNDVDLRNPSVVAAIELDPTLSAEERANVLATGSPRTAARRGEISDDDVPAGAPPAQVTREIMRGIVEPAAARGPEASIG